MDIHGMVKKTNKQKMAVNQTDMDVKYNWKMVKRIFDFKKWML